MLLKEKVAVLYGAGSIGGFQVTLHAVEAMRRQYASELGAEGVRFVTLRTAGIPGTGADDDGSDG